MDNSAIRPRFIDNFPSIKRDEEARAKGATDEERNYYGMSQTIGWYQFNKMAEQLIAEMDALNDNAIASGASKEQIGENAIVVSMAKGVIRRLINAVNDAKEACESNEPAGKQ